MRVCLFPADDTACGRYRMRWPAAASGVDAVFPRDMEDATARRQALAEADVVVFQRPAHAKVAEEIPNLQRWGKAVVVDMDDDLAAVDPQHPIFHSFHPSQPENWHNIKHACRLADLVTASTPALAQRYGGPKARVVPNYVPEWMLEVEADRDGRTVGWAGNTVTHVNDLAATGGGVAQALQDTGGRFLLVGHDAEDAKRQLGLRELDTTGYVPMEDYPRAVAQFDVGIAPLKESLFNRAKSALKPLEMAALGVPCVMSPLPDYERVHRDGIGILAERGRDWRREVRRLLQDPVWAEEVAARAEDAVAEHHTLELNGHLWAEAWSDALELRRNTRLARAA